MARKALPAVVIVLAAALLALFGTASPASAATGIRYGITDDAWLLHGPGTLDERLASLDQLGVQVVRFTLRWDEIATTPPTDGTDPADPAYSWDGWDAVVNGLHQHGIETLLGIWGTPSWANGGRGPQWAPTDGSTVADFATAAARRYPWVRRWLVWNEPNQARWLRPTSPAIYVKRILDPVYAALHDVEPDAKVGAGVTAPRGNAGGVSPVDWIAGMRRAGAHLDAYAHNPYPLDPHSESPTSGGCGHCRTYTMATLARLLAAVRRSFGPRVRVWLTEYGYQTRPPDQILGIPPARQAEYLSEAALRAYLAPRVDILIHFLYRDEPGAGGWQSGLVRLNGQEKPAFAAFQVPLAERARHGARVTLWGEVRVQADEYRLEVLRGREWRPLGSARGTSGRGFFSWTGPLAAGEQVRVVAGDVVGPPLKIT